MRVGGCACADDDRRRARYDDAGRLACDKRSAADDARDDRAAAGRRGSALSSAAAAPSRVGIFGGSFDPPHVGHLLAASDAFEALELDLLVFVPAATQPLKHVGRVAAPSNRRLAMVRALVGDDPRFTVDALEIDRGGLSYTVETLETFERRWPGAQQFLLVGADVLHTFARWRDPLRVRALATLVVLVRAVDGVVAAAPDLPGGAPRLLATRRMDVSSTEVRARIAARRSVRGFVPDAVAAIIRDGQLYQDRYTGPVPVGPTCSSVV